MSDLFTNVNFLTRGLTYQGIRHAQLTANIANAQTPGYRPKDVSFQRSLALAERLTRTNEEHLDTPGSSGPMRVYDDAVIEPGNDGNAVNMERQMAKLSANGIRYRAIGEMINRRLAALRYAANDGKR